MKSDVGEPKKSLKLAEQLADAIRRQIVAGSFPPGTNLGLEPELIERFGVGRGVLREAIRILEHLSLVEMRRGRSGGLIVREPNRRAVELAVSSYLDFNHVTRRHIVEVRLMLELTCADRLIRSASDDQLRELRERVGAQILNEYETSFHVALAEATGNPILHLFTDVIVQTSLIRFNHGCDLRIGATPDLIGAHMEIADALIARDHERSRRLITNHLQEISDQWTF